MKVLQLSSINRLTVDSTEIIEVRRTARAHGGTAMESSTRSERVSQTAAWALAAALGLAVLPSAGRAEAKLSGVVFADYFYNAQGSGVVERDQAFQFRRIYFTHDTDLDAKFSTRFQLEADQKELTSNGKIGVFVKQAFLKWKDFMPKGALLAGLSPTPLWGTTEAVWGYRSLEKTSLDLRGLGSATDLGVALQGKLGAGEQVGYHLMFANGAGQKPESDRSKKAYAGFPIKWGAAVIEPVADFEGGPGDRDRWTAKLLVGWQKDPGAIGAEAIRRVNLNAGAGGADVVPTGASVFGRAKLAGRCTALARYDWFDPDAEVKGSGYRQHLVIAGVDFAAAENVHVIPNALVTVYSAKDAATADRDTDVVLRVTLVYTWKP